MRALGVSDLHFGAWTADPLLRHNFALRALEPDLDDVDELTLLGDVFDLLFSPLEDAFAQADPFFEILRRNLQGERVVFLAGNQDHHIVVRDLRMALELRVTAGAMAGHRDVRQGRPQPRRGPGGEARCEGSHLARGCYSLCAWPGTAMVIDTERDVPQHIRMLARRNGQP
jgi:hypothetical protein